ncbi:MAG: extracellular solute-binding protein [Clostridiales bacterium]|jgi:multiple sugar transport system substrate-binding protein|nr:extracellular solute-binding protein [Clostridiales bacterium]
MIGKRKLAAALILTALTGLLAGCGGGQTDGGVKKVVIWSDSTGSKAIYDRLINAWNQDAGAKKGVMIDYVVKEGSALTQQIELALQSGQAPDLFIAGVDVEKMVESDFIAPYNELPGGNALIDKYKDEARVERNYIGDKYYSLPYGAATQGMVYNKEMFRAAGIVDANGEPTPPKSYAELREYAKRLTNPDKREYGFILPLKWGGFFGSEFLHPLLSSAGHEGYNPGTGIYDYTPLEPIMSAYLGMKEDGSIYPGAEGLDNDPARAQFALGKIGMKMAYSFDVGVYNDQFPAQFDWGVAPYPTVDGAEKYLQRMEFGSTFYVTRKALSDAGGDVIMEVLKFFTSDDFVTSTYQAGVEIPYNWQTVKDVSLDGAPKGWKEFCALTEISVRTSWEPNISSVLGGQPEFYEYFLSEVWTGKTPVKDALVKYTDLKNDAKQRYYATHPDRDPKARDIPGWNPVR